MSSDVLLMVDAPQTVDQTGTLTVHLELMVHA